MLPVYVVWIGAALNFAACAMSLRTAIRNMREYRLAHRIRVETFALEKQLLEQGATLPCRCVMCCQVLPAHVEECPMVDHYAELGWMIECATRPPIKYYAPKGKEKSR